MPLSSLDANLCSFPEEIWATAFHELNERISVDSQNYVR